MKALETCGCCPLYRGRLGALPEKCDLTGKAVQAAQAACACTWEELAAKAVGRMLGAMGETRKPKRGRR